MTQAYYRKYRPQTWDEVVKQEHVIETLHNAVAADRIAHAYLFAGPRGTGKTSVARILAKAVNCLHEDLSQRPCNQCECCQGVNEARFLDLIEIDAASNTSVDDVRDLRDKINFSPNQGRYKVYIIDEVHMLSVAAFNALLKTLEEPPPHAIFVLATTEVHKIPATVLSRCQRHEFRRIPVVDMVALLGSIAEEESLDVHQDALTLIARQATGSLRDAISLLDQLASMSGTITLEVAQTVLGTATSQAVLDLVDAILAAEASRGLDLIRQTLDAGSDPRQFGRQVVDHLRGLLLIRMGNADQVDATPDVRAKMAQQAKAFSVRDLLRIIQFYNRAANEARTAWQPSLPLELAFIQSIEAPTVSPGTVGGDSQEAPARVPPAKRVKEPSPSNTQPENSPQFETDPLPTDVLQKWNRILATVRQRNPQTQGLLNSCRPLGLKNGVLILGFNHDFPKAKMEQGEHIAITQEVIEGVTGEVMPIKCVTVAKGGGNLPPEVDQDGMVATALRDLGGEIVDIQ